MSKNKLGYLSALLLTAQSVALGMIAPPVQGTQVVPRLAATAPTTLPKSTSDSKRNTLENLFSKPTAVIAQATSPD